MISLWRTRCWVVNQSQTGMSRVALGGVAEVAGAVWAMDGKLRRVDAVGVVEAEVGQVGGAGGGNG